MSCVTFSVMRERNGNDIRWCCGMIRGRQVVYIGLGGMASHIIEYMLAGPCVTGA